MVDAVPIVLQVPAERDMPPRVHHGLIERLVRVEDIAEIVDGSLEVVPGRGDIVTTQGFGDVQRRRVGLCRVQQLEGLRLAPDQFGQVRQRLGRQRHALRRLGGHLFQGVHGPRRVALLGLERRERQPAARLLRRPVHGLAEQSQGLGDIAFALGQLGFFAQVVRLPRAEAALLHHVQLLGDQARAWPVA